MKSLTLLALSLLSLSVLAEDKSHVRCDLTIKENKLDCSLFSFKKCSEKVFKESVNTIEFDLLDGDTVMGKLDLNQLILDPKENEKRDDSIVVFKADPKVDNFSSENKRDVYRHPLKDGINYKIERSRSTVYLKFVTQAEILNIDLTGYVQLDHKMIVSYRRPQLLDVSCKIINPESVEIDQGIKSYIEQKSSKASAQ